MILRKQQRSGEYTYIALLNIRNTTTEGLNTSPAQRLFGRRTKSMMPTEVPTIEAVALQSEEIDRDTTGEASLRLDAADKCENL